MCCVALVDSWLLFAVRCLLCVVACFVLFVVAGVGCRCLSLVSLMVFVDCCLVLFVGVRWLLFVACCLFGVAVCCRCLVLLSVAVRRRLSLFMIGRCLLFVVVCCMLRGVVRCCLCVVVWCLLFAVCR